MFHGDVSCDCTNKIRQLKKLSLCFLFADRGLSTESLKPQLFYKWAWLDFLQLPLWHFVSGVLKASQIPITVARKSVTYNSILHNPNHITPEHVKKVQ